MQETGHRELCVCVTYVRNMLATGMWFHLAAAPHPHQLYTLTSHSSLIHCQKSLLSAVAQLCKPSLLTPDLGPKSLSASFWQSVWGSSLVKPSEERRAICNSFKPEHLPERPSASQCMQFVNLIRPQNVTQSGEIKLSIWQKGNTGS